MTSYPPTVDPNGPVLWWRDGGIAHIRFNRPEALNAIDVATAKAFHQACQDICADAQVRVVRITAAGRAFMAGGDLGAMQGDPTAVAHELISGMHGGLELLAQLPVPVIASVQGAVAGGGLGVMLGCDLVFAADNTKLAIAYPLIGASSDCSTTWGLAHMVGLRKAMEIVLMAEPINAEEALRLGLVNRVLPADGLEAFSQQVAERFANGPTVALGQLKRLVRRALHNDLSNHLQAEAEGFVRCAATADFKEGITAFLDKRPAQFQGQ
ncbi:enoyl-CoA hydratase [Lampropedia aestuarii]|uniref:Enoyl-CoA hydratase n=1 Tax=Lampropedia aestuarii TaxID=2562762 RepID=A0A4S5BH30_9BURK|nr:enoyl-CoA hydratase-related protein [Lampropedia aestuarii]THJ31570.1 enoyl-CoA hydratase [Lampropedia aestuarii]